MPCAKYWRCSQSRSPRERAAKASRTKSSFGSAISIPPRIDGIAPSSWPPSRAVKNQHQPDRALRHGRWLACAVMSRSTPTTQGHLPTSGRPPGAHTDNDLRLQDQEPQYRSATGTSISEHWFLYPYGYGLAHVRRGPWHIPSGGIEGVHSAFEPGFRPDPTSHHRRRHRRRHRCRPPAAHLRTVLSRRYRPRPGPLRVRDRADHRPRPHRRPRQHPHRGQRRHRHRHRHRRPVHYHPARRANL